MIERIISEELEPRAKALINKYVGKTCLLLSGGRTVWNDVLAFTGGNSHSDWDLMAVNDVGMYVPGRLEHWFSCHGEQLPGWEEVRMFHHEPARYRHSMKERHPSCIAWPVPTIGTSSLAAVYVALCLGYDRIVLCGAPLDDEGHFFDPSWVRTNFTNEARHDVWAEANRKIFDGKVKSMSGFSRDILGAP